jgi:hypothetical protein
VRTFFAERGFLEVETPLLSADIVVDRHLDPFSTILAPDARRPEQGRRLWLQTSPEFHMKRLMAAGGEAIYQVTRSFRNGEQGVLHNPEFTIVEWYQRGDDYFGAMDLTSELCDNLLERGPAERLSYRAAFQRQVGVDPHTATGEGLADAARDLGLSPPASLSTTDRDGWLQFLLAELVEPHLGLAGRRSCTTIRPVRPPWHKSGRKSRPSPSGSSCTSTESSWPTAIASCGTRASCAPGSPGRTNKGWLMPSRPCPPRAAFWQRSRLVCRPVAAWPWDSIGW